MEWKRAKITDHIAGSVEGDLVQIGFFQTDAHPEQSTDGVPRLSGHEQMLGLGELHFPGVVLLLQGALCSFTTVEEIVGLIVVQDHGFARPGVTIGDHLQIDPRGQPGISATFFHSHMSRFGRAGRSLFTFHFLR